MNVFITGYTPPIRVLPYGTYDIASVTLFCFVSQMPFHAFSYVSLVVTSVFKFSCNDQCKVSIQVTHHDVYVWLSLWLKLLVIAPESLYPISPCAPDLLNVGLEIAGNVSPYLVISKCGFEYYSTYPLFIEEIGILSGNWDFTWG